MMYQRFLRSAMILFSILTVLSFIVVVPTNATGTNKSLNLTDPLYVEGLRTISMSNIASQSSVLWVHGLMVVVEVLGALLLVFLDYTWYYSSRQKYRTVPTTDHCSVMIVGLDPKELEGETISEKRRSLLAYFENLFPGAIRCVYLVKDSKELRELVKEREKTKRLFELSLIKQDEGKSPNHKSGPYGCCGHTVDSIAHYTQELKTLRNEITEKQTDEHLPLAEVAFVTFTSVTTAEACLAVSVLFFFFFPALFQPFFVFFFLSFFLFQTLIS